jgi:hypothetical protein
MPKKPSLADIALADLVETGNIDLAHRPHVVNPDGSVSTVRSMGVNFGGPEVLIPTVSDDGRLLTPEEAIEQYRTTGKHLGKFKSVPASNAWAQLVHEQQERMLAATPTPAPTELGAAARRAGQKAALKAIAR